MKQLKKSRIAVHFQNATTFLETMSMNFPSVLYFDPIRSPIRSSAQPFYDDLHKVKIFHNSPESAARWINEIYKNPLQWWASPETQEVRSQFCARYAKACSSWNEWMEKLLKMNNDEIS